MLLTFRRYLASVLKYIMQDIQLAKDAYSFSPSSYDSLASQHGVDLILGGHDHEYYVSKAITDWEGFDTTQANPDGEGDTGDILLFKSGTDFREFSDVTIELQDAPEGSVRKKIIQAVHGRLRQCVCGSSALTGPNQY
jgi:5'-nucleotidase